MPKNNHDNENQKHYNDIMKAGTAVTGIGTILPYAVLAGAGLYLYKKYGDDVEDVFSGAGAAGGITETVTETITETITETVNNTTETITETVNNTTEIITEGTNTIIDTLSDAQDDLNKNPILKYFTPDIQRISDMTPEQKLALSKYKSGIVTTKTAASEGSLYNKMFGNESKKTQSPQQAQGLTPMAAKGAKPDIRTSDKNLKKPKIIKKKEQDKFQRAGLTPMAARGV